MVEVFAEASAPNIARGRGRVCSKNPLVRFKKTWKQTTRSLYRQPMSLCTSSTIHTNSLPRMSEVTDQLDQVRGGIRGEAAKFQSLGEGRSCG